MLVKNTALLYVRMFVTLLISLYTSRVVLDTLGVIDYGIYNIVGGIIILFSFLNSAMASAVQRFLNFELGKGGTNLIKIFGISCTIHLYMGILVFIALETIGLFFFFNYLNIPIERKEAAFWVYQFSILACLFSILRIPYNASVIAHEKMTFFAYLSIVEAILKLGIVYLLIILDSDKLILYSILMTLVVVIVTLVYIFYCKREFYGFYFKYIYESSLVREMLNFSGWSLLGNLSNMLSYQGLNFLINFFFGVSANAAMGIATQVNGAVYSFVSNFQIAFNPQIVKSYASKNLDYFTHLIFQTSRLSYYLLLFLSIPILVYTPFILEIWLKEIPMYATDLVRLLILYSLIDSLSAPLWISVQATGKIKVYQLYVSIILFLTLPISFVLLYYGFPIYSIFIVRIVVNIVLLIFRLFYSRYLYGLSLSLYCSKILLPVCFVTIISLIAPILLYPIVCNLVTLCATFFISVFVTIIIIYFIGLTNTEKQFVKSLLLLKR